MKRMRFIAGVLAVCSIVLQTPLYAQLKTDKPTDTSESEHGFVGAPFAEYSPETGVGIGVAGLYYFHIREDSDLQKRNRTSSISLGITYTAKHQIASGLDYSLYFDHNTYYIFGGLDYKQIPFDFFGVGDHNGKDRIDNYTPLWRGGDILVTRNILTLDDNGGVNIGFGGEYRSDEIMSSQTGGPLQTGAIPGSQGGISSGLGWIVNLDTRDNVFSTRSGYYADLRTYYYGRSTGSSFSFNKTTLDTRSFFPVFESHTIALQGLATIVSGVEPFYTMASLGGISNMRGYFEGRFRDNDMAVLQAEYRAPLFWQLGIVGFADVGEVAGTLREFDLQGLKYTLGGGLRLFLSKTERVVVRLDVGFGSDSNEIYFAVNEAF